jgi:hypothetical protein
MVPPQLDMAYDFYGYLSYEIVGSLMDINRATVAWTETT